MAFAPSPDYVAANPNQMMTAAMDVPFRGPAQLGGLLIGDTFSENVQQGAEDSFGAGTFIRDLSTPAGNTPADPTLSALPLIGPIYQGARAGINAFRPKQPSLTPDQYKASPYFRSDIPYDPGMTEDRAAALASYSDTKKTREYFSSLKPVDSFIGNFVGQSVDPINYIPIFGKAASIALEARFGTSLLGRVASEGLVNASAAAINTAAFGGLTAGLRSKFGDDVSWQGYLNEIGMSALIGGAFGAVGAAVGGGVRAAAGSRAAARVLDELRTRDAVNSAATAQAARPVLNEAVGSLAEDGRVSLSDNAIASVQKLADDVHNRTQAAAELDHATASIPDGAKTVTTPQGTKVEVRPEIVDISQLRPAEGALQVRNRDSAASDAQIEQIAADLDPQRLMPNGTADQGAPVVGSDGVIDSGNGRVAAIMRASQAYPEKYAAYKEALKAAGYDVPDTGTPVLVQRRVTELSPDARAKFNTEANMPAVASLNPVERAAMDRSALDEGTLGEFVDGADVTSPANRAFVARFMANLAPNERGALVDAKGTLNAAGRDRINSALVAKAYGDVDDGVLRKFAEATDDNTRAIVGAMADVAGRWAKLRDAFKRGDLDPTLDLTPSLTQGLRILSGWRDQAAREGRAVSTVIREGMAQGDMFGGAATIETRYAIKAMYRNDHYAQAVGRETFAARLGNVMDEIEALGRPQLFERPDVGAVQIWENAANDDRSGDLFAGDRVESGVEEERAAGERLAASAAIGGDRQGVAESGSANGPEPAAASVTLPEIGKPLDMRALPDDQQVPTWNAFIGSQPARTIDELMAVAPAHQDELGKVGEELAAKYGAQFKNPGVKKRATTEQKMVRKRYDSTQRITDVVRGGFTVASPEQAEQIVSDLVSRFKAVDEGWKMDAVNYFDRKVMIQFPDGTIGEVQFWHPEMLKAKSGGGHALYEEGRSLPAGDPKRLEVEAKMRTLYAAALKDAEEDWKPLIGQLDREAGGGSVSGFTTSKGSTYRLHGDGTTTRNKSLHQGHDATDVGPKERSVRTIYLDEEPSGLSSAGLTPSPRSRVVFRDGKVARVTWSEKEKRWGIPGGDDPLDAGFRPYHTEPAVGRYPLELWSPRGDMADEAYSGMHAGNKITQVEREAGGGGTSGNRDLNTAGETGSPESITSKGSTVTQPDVGETTAAASTPSTTAGRPSQSNNVLSMSEDIGARSDTSKPLAPVVDASPGTPDREPAGLPEAAASVGKAGTVKELAEEHGVDPGTLEYLNSGDVDQIKEEGRLSPGDEAALKEEDVAVEHAEAYGRALGAAVRCLI